MRSQLLVYSKMLFTTVALAGGPLIWVSTANADLIGISGATGSMSFTKNATGTVSFTTPGFTGTDTATFQSPTGVVADTGNATFGAMNGTTGLEAGGVFPISPPVTESFSYTSATNSMTGTISWPGIKDDTTTPDFDVNAILTVLSSSGSSTFTHDFPVGGTSTTNFTVDLTSGVTLTNLTGSTSATFSTGEVTAATARTPPDVPEPASLTLLGSALAGLGLLGRWRRRNAA